METIIIAAVAADRAIGRGGDLAFHITADLRRFKALTTGHTVIMGRKTFESLPKGALPGRRNIVVTRDPSRSFLGADTATSIDAALDLARAAGETEAFILGGAQIYAQALPVADRLEITAIEADAPDADAYFPEISPALWLLSEQSAPMTDAKTSQSPDRPPLAYRFETWVRKNDTA